MMWLVRIALKRPYTFVVMSLLIAVLGIGSISANTSALPFGTSAAIHVAVSAESPSGANPMAGQPIFIMRERMDEVLHKLGVPSRPTPPPPKPCRRSSPPATPWTAVPL